MDYKNKYNEALERAREMSKTITGANYEYIFPELKETEDELTWLKNYISEEAYCLSMDIRGNEDRIKLQKLQKSLAWLEEQSKKKTAWNEDDERIRKEIISYIKSSSAISNKEWLAWLERQGEQKLLEEDTFVNIDEVREDFIQEVYRVLDADPTNDRANQIIDAFDNLPTFEFEKQSAAEWSEDDSVRLQRIIDFLWYNRKGDTDTIYQQEQDIEWLKSLKPSSLKLYRNCKIDKKKW